MRKKKIYFNEGNMFISFDYPYVRLSALSVRPYVRPSLCPSVLMSVRPTNFDLSKQLTARQNTSGSKSSSTHTLIEKKIV